MFESNVTTGTVEITQPKSKQIKLTIEKLEGGYISDVEGKRKIYADAEEIVDTLGLFKNINKLEHGEYHMNIAIMHKDDHDIMELERNDAIISLEQAKENGIIEGADKFDPNKTVPSCEDNLVGPIKITINNAYSIDRLKSIDWKGFHEKLFLQPAEITAITGMNNTTLYSSLPKVRAGKFTFAHAKARIGFTILAMYYERVLGVRTSTKEQCEQMKENSLKLIREMELLAAAKYIKSSELMKKLNEMRKLFMA